MGFDFRFGDTHIFDSRALMGLFEPNEGVPILVLFDNYSSRKSERSEVTPIDDDATIPGKTYDFVSLASIVDVDANTHVDICAVVTNNELTTIHSPKKPKFLPLVICDDNNKSLEVILWDTGAVENDEQKLQTDPIVAIKGPRVLDLGDQLLNCSGNTIISPFNEKRAIQVNNDNKQDGNVSSQIESLLCCYVDLYIVFFMTHALIQSKI